MFKLMYHGQPAELKISGPYSMGPAGFDPLTTGQNAVSTTTAYTITGLTSNTDYDYYIQANCTLLDSQMAGPFSFTTACGILVAPYFEDFESFTVGNLNNENCFIDNSNNVIHMESERLRLILSL